MTIRGGAEVHRHVVSILVILVALWEHDWLS